MSFSQIIKNFKTEKGNKRVWTISIMTEVKYDYKEPHQTCNMEIISDL